MRQRHNGAVHLSVAWLLTDGLLASQLDPGACPFHQLTVPVLVAHDVPRLSLPVWSPSLGLCSTSLVHRFPGLALRLLPLHRSVAPVRVLPRPFPTAVPGSAHPSAVLPLAEGLLDSWLDLAAYPFHQLTVCGQVAPSTPR
jgi:hypothetical protein